MTQARLIIRYVLAAWMLLTCVPANAQFFKNLDEWLRKKQARQVYDTTYIYRPQERWLIRTRSILSGEGISMKANAADIGDYTVKTGSGLIFKQTIGGGYRNLSLDLGFSPGKKPSADLNLKVYGNLLGLSVGGSIAHSYKGQATLDGMRFDIVPGDVIGLHAYANAYFAFNGRRFSLPAATHQNYKQLRSAGSPLLTVKTQLYGIVANPQTYPDAPVKAAITSFAGIGAGYGYNFVPNEHWLIHINLTETAGLFCDSGITKADGRKRLPNEAPVLNTNGDLAVFRYQGKWYFGAHVSADDLLFFSNKEISFSLNKLAVSAYLTAGVRF